MYKDVKKKLLSVALCICMVIGMVQVVPKVKAETNLPIKVTGTYNDSDCTYLVEYDTSTKIYNGESQSPGWLTVAVEGNPNIDVNGWFKLVTVPENPINAGSYDLYLQKVTGNASLNGADVSDRVKIGTQFTIKQATVTGYHFECSNPVAVTSKDMRPVLSVAMLSTTGGQIKLNDDQYEVDPVSETGYQKSSAVRIVDSNLKNNINDNSGLLNNATVQYSAGYDLSGNGSYKIAFIDKDNKPVQEGTVDYTGKPITPNLGIFDVDNDTLVANVGSTFSVTPATVTGLGTYPITVTPGGDTNTLASITTTGNKSIFFTGSCADVLSLKVKGKDLSSSTVKVFIENPKGGAPIDLNDPNTKLVMDYNGGASVQPTVKNILVTRDDGTSHTYYPLSQNYPDPDFTVYASGDTNVGKATLYIQFLPKSTYDETLQLSYSITCELKFGDIGFDGYGRYPENEESFDMYYSGEPLVANSEVSVKTKSNLGTSLLPNQYTLSYAYWNGSEWVELSAAQAATDPNMASPGRKQIIAKGSEDSIFAGKSVRKEYTVSKVNVEKNSEWFRIDFTNGTSYPYNGQKQTPEVKVIYNNLKGMSDTDVTDDFNISYPNDASVGIKTVTLTAKSNSGFVGTLTTIFTITSLSLADAECVGDGLNEADTSKYSYTGKPIEPALKIGNYVLTNGKDYKIDGYYTEAGEKLDTAPTNPGKYEMRVSEGTNAANVTGKTTVSFTIAMRDIGTDKDVSFTLRGESFEWSGGDTEPEIICGGSLALVLGKDYTVEYKGNYAPTAVLGVSASAIIYGNAPNLTGTKTLSFEITPRSIANANVKVTPMVNGDADTGYSIALNVYDEGIEVQKPILVVNTDYSITEVAYNNGIDKQWKLLTAGSDYTVNGDQISGLQKAGNYRVTIEGINNYSGTREPVTAECGINLANATITLQTKNITYNGAPQYPKITVRPENSSSITFEEGDVPADKEILPVFTRAEDDDTDDDKVNVDAGTVYVRAKGNPEKGYYGITTSQVSYVIAPMDINGVAKTRYLISYDADVADKNAEYDADGKAQYPFTGRTVTPNVEIKKASSNTTTSAPETLEEGLDYTISYDEGDSRINRGIHYIHATGKGNFTGTIDSSFWIKATDMGGLDVSFANEDYTYADGAPTPVVKFNGLTLEYGVDYTYSFEQVIGKDIQGNPVDWKNTYVYTFTGKGNFLGTSCTAQTTVDKTPLWFTTSDPQLTQVYISKWDDEELWVSPGAIVKQPEKFVLTYKRKDGTLRNLALNEDFTIANFNSTNLPGSESQLRIVGKGGFNGEININVPLYTNIGKADLLQDGDKYVGTLFPGVSVSTGMLEEAIKNGNLSDLIRFAPIWTSEGAWIDPSCYTVTLSCGKTPTIGSVIVTVAGNKEKYYAGSQSFTITVTGSLEGNVSRVVIGDNNAVKWNEQPITPDTVKVVVLDNNNNQLKGGYVSTEDVNNHKIPADYDYTVTFEDNNGVGLARAIINGVNKYSGKLEQPFKITYPMNQLTIQIEDKDGVWQDYLNGASYLYKIDTNKNQPKIRLLYPAGNNTTDEVDERCYSITYSGYQTAGSAKAIIGEPESDDYKGILLGTGRTVDYQLEQINLDDVAIEMEHPEQMYTGEEKTAGNIGLKLTYNGYTLGDADYSVLFRNATNTDEVDGKKATVTIAGKGNFTGGATKEFSILPLPLSNTDFINATAEEIIYTGKAEVPRITINQVKGYIRTLREGDDYTIVGYTDETKGASRSTPYTEIGTYYVKVEGLRNYASTTERYCYIKYEIVKREMDDGLEMTFVSSNDCPVINGEPQCVYNGKLHEPSVYVTFNGVELRGPSQTNPQYSLSYVDNRNAGTATVTITGNGSFDGEKTMTFTIAPKDITYEDIEYRDSQGNIFADEQEFKWENNNTPVHPEIIVYDKSLQIQLKNGEKLDYHIDYQDDSDGTQTNAGEVLMTIVGQNNYIGSKQFTYFIGEDISKSYVLVNGQRSYSTPYNGLVQAPQEEDISVVWNSDISDKDENGEKRYKIAYYYYGDEVVTGRFDLTHRVGRDQITEAGTYYVAVVGEPTKGTYAKSDASNSCMYTITPRNIGPSYILVSGYEGAYYYTGQAIEPKGLTVEDTDLPVSSAVNDPQRRSVKLINGKDYTVSYANNISAGKASIIVTGQGNYGGTRTAYFNILSSDTDGNNTWNGSSEGTGSISNGTTTISASDIILGYDNSTYDCMMYNGYERIPTISINGINANEFTVTASNNVRPGVATLTITGRGNNYTGTILKNFNIKADLSKYGKIASIEDQVYTGYQITPQVTLTCGGNLLNQGSDYTVTYMNNTGIGRATVTATATNDSYYIGSATGSFNISNTAGGMEITGYASSYTYTGYAITPDVAVTMNGRLLNRGTDYVVSYYNNVNVGTATMTVTGMGSFSGTKTINYTIEAKNIENCLTTTVTNYKYTGNTYTPSVTVTDSSTGKTLVAGTDYTIVYSNNTNPGTASITVTALSKNYTGSKVIPFKITSAAVSGLRVSSIKNSSLKLSWSSQDYADGYQICNSKNRVIATTSKNSYTVKGLNSCTTYKYKVRSYVENTDGSRSYGSFSTAVSAKTRLNTPKLKAVSTSKGKVTLTWTKVSKATGYEIYYSTKKNGLYTRLKTISKSSSRKYVDSGLASGEKYYYTIRAYRTTNGVKTYSSYNTIKAVRVK